MSAALHDGARARTQNYAWVPSCSKQASQELISIRPCLPRQYSRSGEPGKPTFSLQVQVGVGCRRVERGCSSAGTRRRRLSRIWQRHHKPRLFAAASSLAAMCDHQGNPGDHRGAASAERAGQPPHLNCRSMNFL